MLKKTEAQDRAADLVARAMRAGADAADAVYGASAAISASVRLGALEDVSRSENGEIGLRIFSGRRSATASSSDLSTAALDALVERTLAMARAAPEDAFAGLAPETLIARGPFADFDGDDGTDVLPDVLKARALAAEAAALDVRGVTNSQGGSASASRSVTALATSHGFSAATTRSGHGVSVSVLAGEGGAQERDYAYHSVPHLADLDAPEAVGREAGARAVARLNPERLKSGPLPVVFDPRVATSLLAHMVGAITGGAIARKTSFLLEALGTQLFDAGISIIDDPHRVRGPRSRAYDGEGLPTAPRTLIDKGVLTGWIAEAASARQIGIAPTGHAARGISGAPGASTTNLHLAPGSVTPAALMADIVDGFYVTELIGMGVNGITGDYSRGASGRRIVRGTLAGAVSEVTIAGNLKAMFRALVPADDLVFRQATNAPTLRIDGMTIAGG
ncbi:MAG: TldD/PmbA family protein [Sphingomonadaceae bacterium]